MNSHRLSRLHGGIAIVVLIPVIALAVLVLFVTCPGVLAQKKGSKEPAPKLPVPSQAQQEEILSGVEEAFELKKATTAKAKAKLAAELLETGQGEQDATTRYVLLHKSWEMAVAGNDFNTAMQAIGLLSQKYEMKTWQMKVEVIQKVRPKDSRQIRSLVGEAMRMMENAAKSKRFDEAIEFARIALEQSRRIKDVNTTNRILARGKQITADKKAYATVAEYFEVLKTKPNDPEANYRVGKYYCFTKNDWRRGLRMLSKGSNTVLKDVAKKDLANPRDAKGQETIADTWWSFSAKASGPLKKSLANRAIYWYQKALSQQSGLSKIKLQKRLEAMGVEIASSTYQKRGNPIPDDEAIKKAKVRLQQAGIQSSDARTAKEKVGLSSNLQGQARYSKNSATRYVMLTMASDLAAAGGSLSNAFRAADMLAESHQINVMEMKADLYVATKVFSKDARTRRRHLDEGRRLMEQAVQKEQYAAAIQVATAVSAAARKMGDRKLQKTIFDRKRQIQAMQTTFKVVQAAMDKLETNPEDPGASTKLGLYYILKKKKWKEGLPLLAQGSDAKLKAAAEMDLASPDTPAQQVKLGTIWFELSKKEKGSAKKVYSKRAASWYLKAWPHLSGVMKTAVKQKLAIIGTHPADAVFFNGHWYKAFSDARSWDKAHQHCKEMRGYLVAIETAEENSFVSKLASSGDFWIGAYEDRGAWYWVTRKRLEYTAWKSGEPNKQPSGSDRALFTRGIWRDRPRAETYGYVSEWDH